MANLKDQIRKQWDLSSKGYDSQHAHGIQTYEEQRAWDDLFRSIIGERKVSILDVGCGTGVLSFLLAEMGHTVQGIDLSEGMLNKAQEKAASKSIQVQFSIEDAEKLPYADNSFDVVVNRHLLWTLPDPDKALGEWFRVLKPGGTVVIIDGLWFSGSIPEKFRKIITNLGVLVFERKNLFKRYYSSEVIQELPHPCGMNSEIALSYVKNAGLVDSHLLPLKDIMAIQRKYMPLSRKFSYQMPYYLITGIKPS